MNSARPITCGWPRSATRSTASSRAPEVSNRVAGTHEESCTLRSITVAHEELRK